MNTKKAHKIRNYSNSHVTQHTEKKNCLKWKMLTPAIQTTNWRQIDDKKIKSSLNEPIQIENRVFNDGFTLRESRCNRQSLSTSYKYYDGFRIFQQKSTKFKINHKIKVQMRACLPKSSVSSTFNHNGV